MAIAGRSILVTGGAGFLGSHVVEALRARGAASVFVPRKRDYDLVEREACRRLLADAKPDLVIVDGGKPQVNAAKVVLDELGLHDLPLAGLAKEREELFLPGRSDPVVLPATSSALYLVQRLRDEAHRFAITYHRTLRDRRTVKSAFDDLPGVGPKRKRELLKVFGSIKRVREAPVEQIAAVPGISRALAERIKATLEA